MSFLKFRLTMIGTLVAIIGLSTLFFTVLLSLMEALNTYTLALFVLLFNVLQWLIAPYLIDIICRVKKVSRAEKPELYGVVERLSKKSGVKTPQLMISRIPIPNAFAYGSPLTQNRVAVTTGLLHTLDSEEVEAVIGHELGHLKHRDVQVMMFVSILPAVFYYVGYSLMWASFFYGGRRNGRGNTGVAALIGFASMAFYFVLTLFTLYFSRLREYYADRHSATVVDEGARKLSEGLAKIAYSTERMRRSGVKNRMSSLNSLKALFISDPERARKDARAVSQIGMWKNDRELVTNYLNKKVSRSAKIAEAFSTHPNIINRLKNLQALA